MKISEVMKKVEEDPTLNFRRCHDGISTEWMRIGKRGDQVTQVWLTDYDVVADDWEIKPKPKTLGQINYEAHVGDAVGLLAWEQLRAKGNYERAAEAVVAAAKEREEADRA